MSRVCREVHQALMDRPTVPRLQDLPSAWQAHLQSCRACQEWLQYLQAEAEAWQALTVPAVPATAWKQALTRGLQSRPWFRAVALAGVGLAGMLLAVFLLLRPSATPVEPTEDLVVAVEAATRMAPEGLFQDPLEQAPEYLEASGLWWTEEDLQAISQIPAPQPEGKTQSHAPGTIRASGRRHV